MREAIIKIPAELFALVESSHFEGELDIASLTVGPDEYRFDDAVRWEVDVTNTGAALLVEGDVGGYGVCSCSRCLDEAGFDFSGRIEGFFLVGDELPDSEDEGDEVPGEDEFDVLPDDHRIDLEPLIKAALIVDAPQMPLCRDDCAGLCPSCGANLNDGSCGCGGDEQLAAFDRKANPFSVLAGLKFDD